MLAQEDEKVKVKNIPEESRVLRLRYLLDQRIDYYRNWETWDRVYDFFKLRHDVLSGYFIFMVFYQG
jgi:hypothetical protein